MKTKKLSKIAAMRIEQDLRDRRGLRQVWESIDITIRAEIMDDWAELIEKTFSKEK